MDYINRFFRGESVAGSKLKEAGQAHWTLENTDATNSSGFTALPGGFRDFYDGLYRKGKCYYLSRFGTWWTTTMNNNNSAYERTLFYNEIYIYRGISSKNFGYSVRCLKDISTSINNSSLALCVGFYPNPVIDKLYIKQFKSLNPLVVICDLQGNVVLNKQVSSNPIDISNFPKGIYLIKIVDSENIVINKMVKE